MDALFRDARLLIGLVIFTVWLATRATAEDAQVQFYNSSAANNAKLPFSQAVRVGDVLYLSGAIGLLPGKRELVPGGIEPETKQVMNNIGEVLKANDLTFDDVFKCTVMLAHMFNWGAFNKIYVSISSRNVCPRDPRSVPTDWLSMPKSSWNVGPMPINDRINTRRVSR
jgi:enamine deaminase RidA (YjgF/YER057c/UK114 family)